MPYVLFPCVHQAAKILRRKGLRAKNPNRGLEELYEFYLWTNNQIMKAFTVPGYEQVDDAVKPAFDQYKKLLGFMPNLYATIGYSAVTLNSYLAYTSAQAKGSFHAKEREAIYLMVSQLNYCEYCLASHTAKGRGNIGALSVLQ